MMDATLTCAKVCSHSLSLYIYIYKTVQRYIMLLVRVLPISRQSGNAVNDEGGVARPGLQSWARPKKRKITEARVRNCGAGEKEAKLALFSLAHLYIIQKGDP